MNLNPFGMVLAPDRLEPRRLFRCESTGLPFDEIERQGTALRRRIELRLGSFDAESALALYDGVCAGGGSNLLERHYNRSWQIAVWPDKSFQVNLPPYGGPVRDNWHMCWALAHVTLHVTTAPVEPVALLTDTEPLANSEACRFAAALAMPEPEFKAARLKFRDDEFAIAGHFQVSVDPVRARMTYVG